MSGPSSVCRTCGKNVKSSRARATKLFDQHNYHLISLIENITDMYLEFDTTMPDLICHWCKQQLDRILAFRMKCLDVHQSFLASNRKRLEGVSAHDEELDEQEVEQQEPYQVDKVKEGEAEQEEHRQSPRTRPKRAPPSSKTWFCEQCGGVFKGKSILDFKIHLQRHTGHKPFECDLCQSKFYTKYEMRRHRILHSDARPYACRFCTKTFRSCSSKAIHERNHTNERPFQCHHCEKTFTSSSSRQRHEMVHTEQRKYHCDTCNQWFQRSSHLTLHKTTKLHQQRLERASTA
ncbi:transcription factor Ouib isoform X2 [Drosophila biarmipes]|uniref:transcription factor Ouib isoform X2 n=1 Tax=Drosophila biarmipes TaxID=125945 RepID=UPI0007E6D29E|nr:transcription factor Ouib isoform X2 [Drosophila biarmipes]